jgi:hypothetical protein
MDDEKVPPDGLDEQELQPPMTEQEVNPKDRLL